MLDAVLEGGGAEGDFFFVVESAVGPAEILRKTRVCPSISRLWMMPRALARSLVPKPQRLGFAHLMDTSINSFLPPLLLKSYGGPS